MTDTAQLYGSHLEHVLRATWEAMVAVGCETLVIASGSERDRFLDDMPPPFKPHPPFCWYLPLTEHPGCFLVLSPGKRPRLIYLQPVDYWHKVPEAPRGDFVDHFDIDVIRKPDQARALLPKAAPGVQVIAEHDPFPDLPARVEPELLARLHYARSCKTDYELHRMRAAQRDAVRAHRAAERAFRDGASEFEIHLAYLSASRHAEAELPYRNIIGLNEHGAVLHYHGLDRSPPLQSLSLLIDAGAACDGYAADITRTHARHPGFFADLIGALEAAQLRLCDGARAGVDYRDLHGMAHQEIATILHGAGLVRMSPEAIVESGVSSAFFPHGLGHLIGLQVHDVAGFQAGPAGGSLPRPEGHPYLRLTRTLEPGMVVTIEPGLYFIPALLAALADGPHAGDIAWTEVDALRHYGGIRIEDDVCVRPRGAPENLSREAFSALPA